VFGRQLAPGIARLRVLLVLLAAGLATVLLLRHREVRVDSFQTSFAHVRWSWVIAAILFNLLSAAAGSVAWDTVIKHAMGPPHPRYRDVLSAFCVGLFGNIVLPGRAGEVARVAVLSRRLSGRKDVWATLTGTVVAYRLLDVLPTLALIAYVLLFVPMPHWALESLLLFAAAGVALLVLGFASARRHERELFQPGGRIRQLGTTAREGLGILRAPVPAASATLYQTVAWLAQLLAVFATMRAFGLGLPLSAAALVLVLVNLAILFPVWPGNVGLLQATIAVPLAAYGIDYGRAIAFGVGLQAIEVSVGLGLGLLFLGREGLSLAVLTREPELEEG
jgi:glycosyltransferase 2 family protein